MNPYARLFRELVQAWQHSPSLSYGHYNHNEALAAQLAALYAAEKYPVSLGRVKLERIPKLQGLVALLESYDLSLRQRYGLRGGLYLERKPRLKFYAATVRERSLRVERWAA